MKLCQRYDSFGILVGAMFRKGKRIVFLIGLGCVALWQVYENQKVEVRVPGREDIVCSMPLKDKKNLESLFYDLFIQDVGAYTLFGDKPMFMGSYFDPFITSGLGDFFTSILPCNVSTANGWKVWQKYKHQFPTSKFLIWEEPNPFWEKPHSCVALFLVHKEQFRETVNTYLEDFKLILNRDELSSEELLLESEGKSLFKEVLKMHNGLIGTLFGFGRENAWLFEARDHGNEVPLTSFWDEKERKSLKNNSPLREFMWTYMGICSNSTSEGLGCPNFAADQNSLETQRLKITFLETREKIINYYKGKDLVEATLALLINGKPEG